MVTCLRNRSIAQTVYVLSALLFMAGCRGPAAQTPSPTSTSASMPTYTHYVPKPGSLFKFEFYYPSTWSFADYEPDDSRVSIYSTEFPQPKLPPGSEPDPLVPIILIEVQRVNPATFSLDQEIADFLAMPRGKPYKEIKSDRTEQIDGHPARHATIRFAPTDLSKALIKEEIFLLVDDRYYYLSLSLPEEERHGAFGQGFDQLVRSIRLLD